MNLMHIAADLARLEGTGTLGGIQSKHNALKRLARPVCHCARYTFPHRLYGGKCLGETFDCDDGEISRQQMDREELETFDRTEARAINGGF